MSHYDNDNVLQPSFSGLVLSHPTEEEDVQISRNTAASWKDSLTLSAYLEESAYLKTVPLARDGGRTAWVLSDKQDFSGQRQILASCETFRKGALISDAEGHVAEAVVHGIASVFTPLEHRGHGYAKQLMRKLAERLYTWQRDEKECIGSILYSDIGKEYYANLGWHPNSSNFHVELRPKANRQSPLARDLFATDLAALCEKDKKFLRGIMALPTENISSRMAILPDLDHMGWHRGKEEFACRYLFGKLPEVQGAIAGDDGSQVFATWTRRYYSDPDSKSSANVLYILRLAMEADETATRLPSDVDKIPVDSIYNEQLAHLRAVLQAAQREAVEWKLDVIQIWDPTPLVQRMLAELNLDHAFVHREAESIASGLWYNKDGSESEAPPLWVNNEHYAWL